MTVRLLHGDCRSALADEAAASVDAVVCDPPYELGFMGKGWDRSGVAFDPATWAAVLRVMKPGAYLLAFGGTRTYHRMACAIEDAGFEIRDQIGWAYGSGFPKSHNGEWGGTALKPAWEPIVMARKSLIGTVEENWREHGTGALNIDGCRIDWQGEDGSAARKAMGYSEAAKKALGGVVADASPTGFSGEVVGTDSSKGRWPANLIHDGSEEVVALFPQTASGEGAVKRASSADGHGNAGAAYGAESRPAGTPMVSYGDAGSAARFFYCAKASKEDREDGLAEFAATHRPNGNKWTDQDYRVARGERPPSAESGPRKNHHPTVKPTDLMRWLVRLVTPAGGLVLDPFMGSGSTGKAAMLEGMRFIGIDLTPEYVEIARARIDFARRQGHQPSLLEEQPA